ncbi:hypothetical protein P2W68_01470 [Chryseobacterium arthrosphaerae]|uniref:hypothetical protein n=1 Tax=Chryseobacterium arthrosphaerae TaxID=651561 RepID=UPI0023E0E87B|nr:hypothetical protein [Chryseobacterium arthrosphaerae]WES98294.1 hypothetical protein P2W68_01470 [Chryseobacterium arthrosphaerae]
MIKTIFIPAHFKPIINDVVENVPTGETKKNWFGSEKHITKREVSKKIIGWSDSEIDGERLSNDINSELERLFTQTLELFPSLLLLQVAIIINIVLKEYQVHDEFFMRQKK